MKKLGSTYNIVVMSICLWMKSIWISSLRNSNMLIKNSISVLSFIMLLVAHISIISCYKNKDHESKHQDSDWKFLPACKFSINRISLSMDRSKVLCFFINPKWEPLKVVVDKHTECLYERLTNEYMLIRSRFVPHCI